MIQIIQQGPLAVLAAFVVIHALADFPLQGEFIAKQKTRRLADSPGVWIIALSAHCAIHAGGVWMITGSLAFGAVEWIFHFLIDLGKGEEKFGFVTDQILHLGCKLAYTILLLQGWPAL